LSRIKSGYGRAEVNGATTSTTAVAIDNVSGSIKVGALVSGDGVVNNPVVVSYDGVSALFLNMSINLQNLIKFYQLATQQEHMIKYL